MTEYELVCVLRADATPEHTEKLDGKLQKIFSKHKIEGAAKRDWGKRTLAYLIENHKTGHYYQWVFKGPGQVVSDLEKELGYDDQVLRYMTLKVESNAERDAKPDEYQFGKIDWAAVKKPFERRKRSHAN